MIKNDMRRWFIFFFLFMFSCLVGTAAFIWHITSNIPQQISTDIIASYSVFYVRLKGESINGYEYYLESAIQYDDGSWQIINKDGIIPNQRFGWFTFIAERVLLALPYVIKTGQKQVAALHPGHETMIFDIMQDESARFLLNDGTTIFDMNVKKW
jgi:hypothetical protein